MLRNLIAACDVEPNSFTEFTERPLISQGYYSEALCASPESDLVLSTALTLTHRRLTSFRAQVSVSGRRKAGKAQGCLESSLKRTPDICMKRKEKHIAQF